MNVNAMDNRGSIPQQPIHSASNVDAPPEEVQLDERERLTSNVVGVIAAIVVGIFATIGTFFLTVMLGGGLGLGAAFGISLGGGAGCAVGAFFLFSYAMQQLIKARNSSAANEHNNEPVISPPGSSKGSTPPDRALLSFLGFFTIKCGEFKEKIFDFHNKRHEQYLKVLESLKNQFFGVDPENEVSKELNKILRKEFEQGMLQITSAKDELFNSLANTFLRLGTAFVYNNSTYLKYKEKLDLLPKEIEQMIENDKEKGEKTRKDIEERGRQLKEEHAHELFSRQVDIIFQLLTECSGSVFDHHTRCLKELIRVSESCLAELSQSRK